ncbi:hypothetical protein PGT21_026938 [Puccinia graminis f. sp. tritici]|uniref:Uncharacterized protein n=1 Tax=Puccinia graminis f. sp. tritici TaxID=56615 RepID=A0A5B0R1M1_PUCGR|nr:hypothetical protein PGT21_026938 [Puccinia graminis f. sp. tritici]
MLLNQTLIVFQLLHCYYTASAHPLSPSKMFPKMQVLNIAEISHHPTKIRKRSMGGIVKMDDDLSFHDLIEDLFPKKSEKEPIEATYNNEDDANASNFFYERKGETSKTKVFESKDSFEPVKEDLENEVFDNTSTWSEAKFSDSKIEDRNFHNCFSEESKSCNEDYGKNKNEKKTKRKSFLRTMMNPGKKLWKTYLQRGSSKSSSLEKSKSQSKIKIFGKKSR